MWGATRRMAEALAAGIRGRDPAVTVKLMNAAKEDKNDIITEIFRSKSILIGSSTINRGILHSIGGLLEMIRGLKFTGKSAAAFGSYGWSGESVGQITKALADCGFRVLGDGIKALWMPDDAVLSQCEAYGKGIVEAE
jgi:flavorubredoxin